MILEQFSTIIISTGTGAKVKLGLLEGLRYRESLVSMVVLSIGVTVEVSMAMIDTDV